LRFDYFNMAEFAATLQHLAFLQWRGGRPLQAESVLREVLASLETTPEFGAEDHRTQSVKGLLSALHHSPEYFEQLQQKQQEEEDLEIGKEAKF
jgi:hypothetical protein